MNNICQAGMVSGGGQCQDVDKAHTKILIDILNL